MSAKYDIIGNNYAALRKPDQRIARIIESALGSAQTVLNVGAGTGSYEPTDRSLIAVEPSRQMIRKRSPAAAEAIQASADDLMAHASRQLTAYKRPAEIVILEALPAASTGKILKHRLAAAAATATSRRAK